MHPESTQRELREIVALAERDRLDAARDRCRHLLAAQPALAPAWLVTSRVELLAGRPLEALKAAAKCLDLDSRRPPAALLQMAHALRALYHVEEALVPAREALASRSADAGVLDDLGVFFSQSARYPEAFEAHQRAVALAPDDDELRFHLLTVARYLGRFDEAEAECDQLAARGAVNGEVYLVRSQLRSQVPERNHVPQLREQLARSAISGESRVQVHYALGKELEDLGDFLSAFENFTAGARQHRAGSTYAVASDLVHLDRIREAFDADWLRQHTASSLMADPIFVIGLPRSGTTLVERILSTHPAVSFSGELRSFGEALSVGVQATIRKVPGARERVLLARTVSPEMIGKAYLKLASLMTRREGRFIDKLPSNYLHCALIKAALPRARIVHLSRHPMANCFAMFKTWFNEDYQFSYDLGELAQYYAAYRRLMAYWSASMPGAIIEVNYERLVGNFESEARRIVAACGLKWDDRCLAFHENPSASTTASSVQVRTPVYSTGLDQWRHYEPGLAPLREALVAAGISPTECA